MSFVYGKCSREARYPLWEKLREISSNLDGQPWLFGGDFNIFLAENERQGSTHNRQNEMVDFAEAIEDCQLIDPGYDGPTFTWARGALFERLDRVLIGEGWAAEFDTTRVTHLPRVASDHGPLLIRCTTVQRNSRPPFKFQNMWTRNKDFLPAVERTWAVDTGYGGMLNLQLKLTWVKCMLKRWNKEVFGDLFEKLREASDEVEKAPKAYERDPSPSNRANFNRCSAEYILRIKMEEDFWKQKAAVKWIAEGDRNTKYFQGWVRQKWIMARIHKIKVEDQVIEEEGELKASAISFFAQLLAPDAIDLAEPETGLIQGVPPGADMAPLRLHRSSMKLKRRFGAFRPIASRGLMVLRQDYSKLAGIVWVRTFSRQSGASSKEHLCREASWLH